MSLEDRLRVKRQQKRAEDRKTSIRLKQEEDEAPKRELTVAEKIQEVAIEYDIKLSLKPILVDDVTNEYDQRSKVYKMPVNEETLQLFTVMCKLTQQSNKYIGSIKYQKSVAPDCPIHFFPILECSLLRADSSRPMCPINSRSTKHPLYVEPSFTPEEEASSTKTPLDRTLSKAQSLSRSHSQSQPNSGKLQHQGSLSSGSSYSYSESEATTTISGKHSPTPPKVLGFPPKPSFGHPDRQKKEEWLLYIRFTSGSRDDKSSWGSLEYNLAEGRWVSEKLIVKWALQVVRSLWHLYRDGYTFGTIHSKDICLVSDQTVVSMNEAKLTYITKTEERGMALNLYNSQYKGVYIRSEAMLNKLNLERQDIIRKKKQLERQNSDIIEDPGDGVGGLMDNVAPPNLLTHDFLNRAESPTDRNAMRKLFSAADADERDSILNSIGGNIVKGKSKKKDVKIVPEASNRKDAWLQLTLENCMEVKYLESSIPSGGGGDDATSIASDFFSHASSLDSFGMVPEVPKQSKKKRKGPPVIGENNLLRIEQLPKPKPIESFSETTAPKVKLVNTPDLEKFATPKIDEYERTKKLTFHGDVMNRLAHLGKLPKKKLSMILVPCKSKWEMSQFNFKGDIKRNYEDDLRLLQKSFETFLRDIHYDFRCLGIILMEAYIRSNIDYQEKMVMMRPGYSFANLTHFFDISRASKGIKSLLEFCFVVVPEDQAGMITCISDDEQFMYESTMTLQAVDEIVRVLENELTLLGGVGAPDFNAEGSILTIEDRENIRMAKVNRKISMANKAIEGRHLAIERVEQHKKQAEFDMLDGDVQASILRRREAESQSERNRVEREFYFNRALFHRYKEEVMTQWIRESIFQGLVKNYKLKKSGVKMTLDQKHLYDKVVGPVELMMKRILKQDPMIITSVDSEKQALVAATKAAAASVAMGGKALEVKKAAEERKEKKRIEEAARRAEEEEKKKKKKKKSKSDTDDISSVATGGTVDLEEMSPLELDKAYMHCFEKFASRMTMIYCKSLNMSITDVKISKQTRIAFHTSFQVRSALKEAEEKLKKSPVTALLPLVQFNEKVLVAAARMMGNWEIMEEVGTQLCSSYRSKDKAWPQKAISCLSSCLILKYSSDEKNRLRGENIAANMLQGAVRGFITRCKMKRIWEAADRKYEKEYEQYLEDQLAEKYLREAEAAKAVEEKNELESHKRKMLLKKIGVDWSEAYVHKVTVNSVVVQINMRIGGKLPQKDYFRNKSVKCVVRMFEEGEQLPDVNCTEYVLKHSSTASTLSDITHSRIGQLEVLIDDKKAIDQQTSDWSKYSANVVMPSALHWDSTTKLKKSKLINVFDTHDDGRDLDIATCFLTINGLSFNSCYNVKLNLSPAYNPELTCSEGALATVAVLEFITSPVPPGSPVIRKPDIIHFDHAITVTKDHKRIDDSPLLDDDYNGYDDVRDNLNNDGLSIVDRLEKFKIEQLERKQAEFTDMSPKKATKVDPPTKQIIDRRISCRVQWDIPNNNGSQVSQYELQRRNCLHNDGQDIHSANDWITLASTQSNFYTDTIHQLDRKTGTLNTCATYRVRAENAEGWGHFCHPFEVSLLDKLSHSLPAQKPKKTIKYATNQPKQLLLPHGVTVKSVVHGDFDDDVSVMTDNTLHVGVKILSTQEVKDILHSNMLCIPAPRPDDFMPNEDDDDMGEDGQKEFFLSGFEELSTPKKVKKVKESNRGTGSNGSATTASFTKKSGTGIPIVNNDSDRLKSVTLDTHSTLAGDTLENVSDDLQMWLARLADACPLDEKEDMWQTKKRLAAKESLHTTQTRRMEQDLLDKQSAVANEDAEDCYDPFIDINPSSVDYAYVKNENQSDMDDHNEREDVKSGSDAIDKRTIVSPSPSKLFLSKSQPLVMDSVYKQSEKQLRSVTENGGNSELDNVIQRLAMVHKKVPSKTHAPNEKFKFTISPLPAISNKVL